MFPPVHRFKKRRLARREAIAILRAADPVEFGYKVGEINPHENYRCHLYLSIYLSIYIYIYMLYILVKLDLETPS